MINCSLEDHNSDYTQILNAWILDDWYLYEIKPIM